ncbi:MAG: mechanosensitive ion channel family protein [Bacteroidales bacterium]|nr:mechanosensitive ion channel family protein [Bacteroidales bacterium]
MNKKRILTLVLALAALVPAFAVLNEKDLAQTLSVLRYELQSAWKNAESRSDRMRGRGQRQHAQLVEMMQRSNELSLMLYSQKQDYTFDMTYALNEVSRQYTDFAQQKLPFDDIITRLDIDIDRYDRLIHTLKRLPPAQLMAYRDSTGQLVYMDARIWRARLDSMRRARGDAATRRILDTTGRTRPFSLDSLGQQDRDSCIFYAEKLLSYSIRQKDQLVRDSTHYAETAALLKSTYDYAQQRYKTVQNKIFVDGQTPYGSILKSFPRYWQQAMADARDKYSPKALGDVHSQWRGPMVTGFSLFALFYLALSILLSVLVVNLLTRKVSFFRRDRFRNHRFEMTAIIAVVIFALSIMVASAFSRQNFLAMASKLLVEFAWMLAAILVSLVIRLESNSVRKGIGLYFPILLLSLIVISLRIAFIPNSLLNIIFPPVLLLFTVFQGWTLFHYRKDLPSWDIVYGWISLLILLATTVVAFFGYVLLGVQLLIWWIFQLTLLQTVTAVYDLLQIYYVRHIRSTKQHYIDEHPNFPHKSDEDLIAVTWPHSLMKQALLPVFLVLSVPFSLFMASSVFDLNGVFHEFYNYPFLNVEGYIHLSMSKLFVVVALFFLFRYLAYAGKAAYRLLKVRSMLKGSKDRLFHENSANFTLAENIIGISLWIIYVIVVFVLLKIPTNAIKVIGAGLATGLGFAMKDVLNNFFCGVQLMSGRLRVGDFIECDGIRGKVDAISYQSTQIIASDGSVMAFPNATLFNKNFKNLTLKHSYELVSFEVGVKYGVDVDAVRKIIQEALEPLRVKDVYGRDIVDPAFGIEVRFKDFGDNSVNLSVLQYITVDEHYTYPPRARERIYNALNEHDIEIPYPQRDLHIKMEQEN